MIRVQTEDFDIGQEIEALRQDSSGKDRTDIGAIVTFTGTVRDALRESDGENADQITSMTLEH